MHQSQRFTNTCTPGELQYPHNIVTTMSVLYIGSLTSPGMSRPTHAAMFVCRLMHFDMETLYELHYQMITLGKVGCL